MARSEFVGDPMMPEGGAPSTDLIEDMLHRVMEEAQRSIQEARAARGLRLEEFF